VGWRRASRAAGEPATQEPTSGSGSGGRGKAWSSLRSSSHERDSRLQGQHDYPVLTRNGAPGSTIYTDGLKSFAGLDEAGFEHITRIQPLRSELRKGAKSAVPLADRAIGNLQGWLIGTYHGVSKAQLQVYLDEFVFRHNRRKTPAAAFQTLLGLGTCRKSTEYEQIRGARDLNHNRLGVAEATR